MQKSDKLKEKARMGEIITQIPHLSGGSNMDMALNDCDKIKTHKNMFEDQKFKKEVNLSFTYNYFYEKFVDVFTLFQYSVTIYFSNEVNLNNFINSEILPNALSRL